MPDRKALSNIISALIIMMIVVTAGALFYAYGARLLGSLQPPPPNAPENLVIEMIAFTSNGAALVTVRNIGMGNSNIAAIYVDGMNKFSGPPVSIPVNQAYTFTLPSVSATQHWFKVVTVEGFIVSTYGPQTVYIISYTTETIMTTSIYTTTVAVTSTLYSTQVKTTSTSTITTTFLTTSTGVSTSTTAVSTYYKTTSTSTSSSTSAVSTYYKTTSTSTSSSTSAVSTYYKTTSTKTTTISGTTTTIYYPTPTSTKSSTSAVTTIYYTQPTSTAISTSISTLTITIPTTTSASTSYFTTSIGTTPTTTITIPVTTVASTTITMTTILARPQNLRAGFKVLTHYVPLRVSKSQSGLSAQMLQLVDCCMTETKAGDFGCELFSKGDLSTEYTSK